MVIIILQIIFVAGCTLIIIMGFISLVKGYHKRDINRLKLEIASLKAKRQQIIHDIEDKFVISMNAGHYTEMLSKQDELRRAIEKEDYIEAARLRDELKQLNQK